TVDYKLSKTKQQRATKKTQELKEKSMNLKQANKNLFEKPIDLMEISFPTNKVSFICNPIERFSKEPWCWYEITQLMMSAKNSIFVQSPYVVPNRQMTKGFINPSDFEGIDVAILTNSIASSPNFPAYSGYLNHKKAIIKSGVNVFEFQSQDSLHTKSFIIDDNLLAIGSFNSDPRSTYLSTESMIVVHSSEAVKKIEEGIMDYIDQSLLVSKDYTYLENSSVDAIPASFTKRFTIKLLSFIAIFFEYML
ncbi:MAG: phospholipase D-like domain-containing protein, partial [Acutalibacteraceae bacterium]